MRAASITRETRETKIKLNLALDMSDDVAIDSGIGFFDHMLELLAHHAGIGLRVSCAGDVRVDGHHSVEDIGITFGKALKEALGDKAGIARYGFASVPMDEALCDVSLDISGRPYLVFNAELSGKAGDFDLELVEEFLRAAATYGGLTLHVNLKYGANGHHKAEAIFKAFAHALAQACAIVGGGVPSTKGVLE